MGLQKEGKLEEHLERLKQRAAEQAGERESRGFTEKEKCKHKKSSWNGSAIDWDRSAPKYCGSTPTKFIKDRGEKGGYRCLWCYKHRSDRRRRRLLSESVRRGRRHLDPAHFERVSC